MPRGAYGLGLTLEVAHSGVERRPDERADGPGQLGPALRRRDVRSVHAPQAAEPTAASRRSTLSAADAANLTVVPEQRRQDQHRGRPVQREPAVEPGLAVPDGQARRRALPAHDPGPADVPAPAERDRPGWRLRPDRSRASQFIFGGDSHLYVPNGGLEVCAGPNPTNEGTGKQIAVYGVPATPRLVPTVGDGHDRRRDELDQRAAHRRGLRARVGDDPVQRHRDAAVPGLHGARRLLDRHGRAPRVVQPADRDRIDRAAVPGADHERIGVLRRDERDRSGAGNQAQTFDVSSCMKASNHIASAYDVKWSARGSGQLLGATCPQLDGIEFIVTLDADRPEHDAAPAEGLHHRRRRTSGTASSAPGLRAAARWTRRSGTSCRAGGAGSRSRARSTRRRPRSTSTTPTSTTRSRAVASSPATCGSGASSTASGYNEPAFSNWIDTDRLGAPGGVLRLRQVERRVHAGGRDPQGPGRGELRSRDEHADRHELVGQRGLDRRYRTVCVAALWRLCRLGPSRPGLAGSVWDPEGPHGTPAAPHAAPLRDPRPRWDRHRRVPRRARARASRRSPGAASTRARSGRCSRSSTSRRRSTTPTATTSTRSGCATAARPS